MMIKWYSPTKMGEEREWKNKSNVIVKYSSQFGSQGQIMLTRI